MYTRKRLREQRVGERLERRDVLRLHPAADGHKRTGHLHRLHRGEHFLHHTPGGGSPGAVLHKGDATLLVGLHLQGVEEIVGGRKKAAVIGCGQDRHFSIAEGVFHGLRLVVAGFRISASFSAASAVPPWMEA